MVAIIATMRDAQNSSAEQQLILQDMEAAGTRTIDFITRSPGETTSTQTQTPTDITDWENEPGLTTVKFIGLANRERVIDTAKIKQFVYYLNNNYADLKGKMLLGYDFYFRFYYFDDSGDQTPIKEPLGTPMAGGLTLDQLRQLDTQKQYTNIIFTRIVNYEGTTYSGEAVIELQIYKEKQ